MDASNLSQNLPTKPASAILGRIGLGLSTMCLLVFAGVVLLKPG